MTSIAPLQSVLGTFGRGMGLLTIGSAVLLFFLIQSECRAPRDPLKAEFNQPHGVIVHPKTGDVYISDASNGRVLKIVRD